MEVILLERIARLGQMGDVVRVKTGFARNFLLPQGKALRSNAESRKRFERGVFGALDRYCSAQCAPAAEPFDNKFIFVHAFSD